MNFPLSRGLLGNHNLIIFISMVKDKVICGLHRTTDRQTRTASFDNTVIQLSDDIGVPGKSLYRK